MNGSRGYEARLAKRNTRLDMLQEFGHLAAFIDCQDGNRIYGLAPAGYSEKK